MQYAVTLPLDADAAAPIERMWRALAAHAGDDDALSLAYAPHITLAVLPGETPAEDLEFAVRQAAKDWAALALTIAGLGVFPGDPPITWAAPVVSALLLSRHASLIAGLSAFSVHPHYHPGSWVPHITLTKSGLTSAARAIEIAGAVWAGPIAARLARVDLVRFRPVEILWSMTLPAV